MKKRIMSYQIISILVTGLVLSACSSILPEPLDLGEKMKLK